MPPFEPGYIKAHQSGRLAEKTKAAYEMLENCRLCPRKCGPNRLEGHTGICKTGKNARVSSCQAHFGEEAPLVGRQGSGTIFFTNCNLLCNFCQNFDISHQGHGQEVTSPQLARMMLALQEQGCHNINLVTPSHVVPQILSALEIATEAGLSIPIVYNCSGYDRVKTLKLLDGVVDIYMPDFKFWDSEIAQKACDAEDYPSVACKALVEMHRQVGDLTLDASGIAKRGLLVRHLVLPRGLAGTPSIMRFIAKRISLQTYVNIMAQYRPCGNAAEIDALSQPPGDADYKAALQTAAREGIRRLDPPGAVFLLG